LRALGITTASRWDSLPEVPTVGEFAHGYEASAWYGIGVPRNTAAEIIGKLNKETCSDSGRKRRIGRPVYGVRPLWHHRRGWRVRR
jgi:Tripartite tricarboxylate transporter family receptor